MRVWYLLGLLSHLAQCSNSASIQEDSVASADRSKPSSAPGARDAVWQPRVQQLFQMILSVQVDLRSKNAQLDPNVEIFDVDLFYTSKNTIKQLKRLGKKVVCYFSAGTAEDWRPDYADFKAADKGSGLPLWQGENYVDIRSSRVRKIMNKRIELAASNGCDAVDPDNMDVYINEKSGKFNLTERDAIDFFKNMSSVSHSNGLAIGLKNVPWLVPSVSDDIEFCVSESCVLTNNCTLYENFTSPKDGTPGRPVFHVEYVNYTTLKPPPKSPASPVNISSGYIPGVTNDALRTKLCLEEPPKNGTGNGTASGTTIASRLKLSTVIKTMDLDGWIMWCNGSTAATKTQEGE